MVEILAYYIPYVDHLLDTASVPLATIAGSIMFAAQFTDLGTFPTWALALIAGGGTAAAIVQDLQEHEPLLLLQLVDSEIL